MFSRGRYFLFQLLLMLLSPVASFCLSLRFYKNEISQAFFVIFACYFGSHCAFTVDLTNHYFDFLNYVDNDWDTITSSPWLYFLGADYYHIVIKFIVSRFTDSASVFGGTVCGIYSLTFIFFFHQLKPYYSKSQSVLNLALLLATVLVVEFYWYQGVRFWTGTLFFVGFVMRYIRTGKWYNLLYACFCPIFHFTLIALVLALLLNILLDRTGWWSRYALLGVSFFMISLSIDFAPFLRKIPLLNEHLSMALSDEKIRESVLVTSSEFRDIQNPYYSYRTALILILGVVITLIWRKHIKALDPKLKFLFGLGLTIITIANFGYGDRVFYERFFKAGVLIFMAAVYAFSVVKQGRNQNLTLVLFAFGVVAYTMLVAIVQQRNFLFDANLIFGNFFMSDVDMLSRFVFNRNW